MDDIREKVLNSACITPFQRMVYLELLDVPAGETITYGELARRIGCGSAQAVGQALKRNPFAPDVPCHRVVAADGSLGGYMGKRQPPSIKRVLKNPEKTLRGFHWEYAGETWEEWRAKQTGKKKDSRLNFFTEEEIELLREEYPNRGYNIPELLLRHSKQSIHAKAIKLGIKVSETRRAALRRPVVCVETGRIFESVRAAAAFAGSSSLHKNSLIKGNATGGYHWKYLD